MIKKLTPEEQQFIDEEIWEDIREDFIDGLDEFWGDFIDQGTQEQLSRKKKYGFNCVRCEEYYEYAESNQKDGTFKCWGCRNF